MMIPHDFTYISSCPGTLANQFHCFCIKCISFLKNDLAERPIKIRVKSALSCLLIEILERNQCWLYFCSGRRLCNAKTAQWLSCEEKCERIKHCNWSPDLWRIFSENRSKELEEKFVD